MGAEDPRTFARSLEATGDVSSALLEWRRLAYTRPDVAEEAQLKVATLLAQQGRADDALTAFEAFGAGFPASPHIPVALATMARLADSVRPNGGAPFRERLDTLFPTHEATREAHWAAHWDALAQGRPIPSTDPRAPLLADRLAQAAPGVPAAAAAAANLVPGLGHLLLGDWRTALTAFVLVGLLAWATASVARAHLWGLAELLGFVTLTTYAGGVFSAYSLALREAREARLATLTRATDLAPKPLW